MNNKSWILIFLTASLLCLTSSELLWAKNGNSKNYAPGEIIIKFKDTVGSNVRKRSTNRLSNFQRSS